MRVRRLVRRLVGLPLVVGLLLCATPALAGIRSTTAPPSAQSVSTGTWRMIFSTTSTPASPAGTVSLDQPATGYVYLVNSGNTGIPASYPVALTIVSTDNSSITFTACVGGTWTSATTCSGTPATIGSTTAVTSRWTAGTVAPAGSTVVPPSHAVHVRVVNSSPLAGLSNGKVNPSVSVGPV